MMYIVCLCAAAHLTVGFYVARSVWRMSLQCRQDKYHDVEVSMAVILTFLLWPFGVCLLLDFQSQKMRAKDKEKHEKHP